MKGLRQRRGHICYVRGNHIDWVEKGDTAGGKSANSDIMQR
jgi:hypothetical protein